MRTPPPGRRNTCPECRVAPGNRCRHAGQPVTWHHDARIRAAGTPVGSRPKLTDAQRAEALRLAGLDWTRDRIARHLKVSRSTLYRHLAKETR